MRSCPDHDEMRCRCVAHRGASLHERGVSGSALDLRTPPGVRIADWKPMDLRASWRLELAPEVWRRWSLSSGRSRDLT